MKIKLYLTRITLNLKLYTRRVHVSKLYVKSDHEMKLVVIKQQEWL